jgi:hypothetical protein
MASVPGRYLRRPLSSIVRSQTTNLAEFRTLKEWGRVNPGLGGVIFLFLFSAVFRLRLVEAAGSRIGRRPTAERPEVLDADVSGRMLVEAERNGSSLRGWCV